MADNAKQLVEQTLRDSIEQDLARCTEPQQEFFRRIFPGRVATDKLESAYDLIQRTLRKNEEGRA